MRFEVSFTKYQRYEGSVIVEADDEESAEDVARIEITEDDFTEYDSELELENIEELEDK